MRKWWLKVTKTQIFAQISIHTMDWVAVRRRSVMLSDVPLNANEHSQCVTHFVTVSQDPRVCHSYVYNINPATSSHCQVSWPVFNACGFRIFQHTLCKYKCKLWITKVKKQSTNRVERQVQRHETPSLVSFHFKQIKSSTILHANGERLPRRSRCRYRQ